MIPELSDLLSELGLYVSHGDTLPPTSEDCLKVNIFTPSTDDGQRRPVMVWLHGGALAVGSGSEPVYDGTALAERGNVVVVTVTHRLGVLGYLYLGALGEGYERSGNAGTLDQVAALHWIQENIDAFGGDPGNVTLFGESGGGLKIGTLLALPEARGLFHRAILQSAVTEGVRVPEPEAATELAIAFLKELDLSITEVHKLQELPVEQLIEGAAVASAAFASSSGLPGSQGMVLWQAVVDKIVVMEHPWQAENACRDSDVPIIIGTNTHEASVFNGTHAIDAKDLEEQVAVFAGDKARELIEVYRRRQPLATNQRLLVLIMSDWLMRLPTIKAAEFRSKMAYAPVYVYQFAAESPFREGVYGAFHGIEMPLVFHHPADVGATADWPAALTLADKMTDTWVAFARTGNPNHPGLPDWPAYNSNQRATMIFDIQTHVEMDPFADERLAWDVGEEIVRAAER